MKRLNPAQAAARAQPPKKAAKQAAKSVARPQIVPLPKAKPAKAAKQAAKQTAALAKHAAKVASRTAPAKLPQAPGRKLAAAIRPTLIRAQAKRADQTRAAKKVETAKKAAARKMAAGAAVAAVGAQVIGKRKVAKGMAKAAARGGVPKARANRFGSQAERAAEALAPLAAGAIRRRGGVPGRFDDPGVASAADDVAAQLYSNATGAPPSAADAAMLAADVRDVQAQVEDGAPDEVGAPKPFPILPALGAAVAIFSLLN